MPIICFEISLSGSGLVVFELPSNILHARNTKSIRLISAFKKKDFGLKETCKHLAIAQGGR